MMVDPRHRALVEEVSEECSQLIRRLYEARNEGEQNKVIANGRTIIFDGVERPRENVTAEVVRVGILNCDNPNCGHGFPIDTTQPNRRRCHNKTCTNYVNYKEGLGADFRNDV